MNRLLLGVGAAALSIIVIAQNNIVQALTATGQARVQIVESLTYTAGDTLDFGIIGAGKDPSVISIAPHTGVRSLVSGDATLIAGGTEGDGTFILSGLADAQVSIQLPVDGTVQLEQGMDTLNVNNFKWSFNGGGVEENDGTFNLDNNGAGTISIGADLEVPANLPPEDYAGTYTITLSYE